MSLMIGAGMFSLGIVRIGTKLSPNSKGIINTYNTIQNYEENCLYRGTFLCYEFRECWRNNIKNY